VATEIFVPDPLGGSCSSLFPRFNQECLSHTTPNTKKSLFFPGLCNSLRYEKIKKKAKVKIKKQHESKIDTFHWSFQPTWLDEIEEDAGFILVIEHDDKSIDVEPPGTLIHWDSYIRNKRLKKERWVFNLEVPKNGQSIPWNVFKKNSRPFLKRPFKGKPRARQIFDIKEADALCGLWTAHGRRKK
jgi:hypothetical protein